MRFISIKLLMLIEFAIALLVCGVLASFNRQWGLSALLGIAVMGLANGYFIKTLFDKRAGFDPKRIIINFYRGELGKLAILAVGTVLCAKYIELTWWAFILGVAVIQVGLWFAPMCIKRNVVVNN